MDVPDPIDAYLRELKRELRVRRRTRRRILEEVRAHLLDAAEGERSRTAEGSAAAERAVVRFGLAAETARQFNRVTCRRGVVPVRALVPWIAAVALSSLATATVWAFDPGPVPPQTRLASGHLAQRQRCVPRAGMLSPARRGVQRPSFPPAPRTQAACGARDANAR
jgi:hypothetical protein